MNLALANVIQAARGPILLITVGVLMVIDYNTPYSFGRTWPALIIVFGVLKLMERMMAGPPQPPAMPAGAGIGYPPPAGGYPLPAGGYQGPGTYPGSPYEAGPGYVAPTSTTTGNPPATPGGTGQ